MEKRAKTIYAGQRTRCNNPKSGRYKTYGGAGIRVEYSLKEFRAWYMENIIKFKGKNPVVGRIDHSKNYSFDNIEIQELSENSRERMFRVENPAVKKARMVECFDVDTGVLIFVARTTREAARLSGRSKSAVHDNCAGGPRQKRYHDFIFRYQSL